MNGLKDPYCKQNEAPTNYEENEAGKWGPRFLLLLLRLWPLDRRPTAALHCALLRPGQVRQLELPKVRGRPGGACRQRGREEIVLV